MASRPERVVLIRSSRHLGTALAALRTASPGCQVTVVATPGTGGAVAQAGVHASDILIYRTRSQFDAWPLLRSGIPVALWRRGYDRVAVLWQDPDGTDHANVDRAAILLSPSGFDAITPDGTIIRRRTVALLRREAASAVRSILVLTALGLALYLPAHAARLWGRVRGAGPLGTR